MSAGHGRSPQRLSAVLRQRVHRARGFAARLCSVRHLRVRRRVRRRRLRAVSSRRAQGVRWVRALFGLRGRRTPANTRRVGVRAVRARPVPAASGRVAVRRMPGWDLHQHQRGLRVSGLPGGTLCLACGQHQRCRLRVRSRVHWRRGRAGVRRVRARDLQARRWPRRVRALHAPTAWRAVQNAGGWAGDRGRVLVGVRGGVCAGSGGGVDGPVRRGQPRVLHHRALRHHARGVRG
mmetsp:Transcript_4302/g.10170  ORF Transcript_4302/g.10170 Transcript_4302/m.10170 type:complete len:235 (+) Transcript_4302:634-1338(+)